MHLFSISISHHHLYIFFTLLPHYFIWRLSWIKSINIYWFLIKSWIPSALTITNLELVLLLFIRT